MWTALNSYILGYGDCNKDGFKFNPKPTALAWKRIMESIRDALQSDKLRALDFYYEELHQSASPRTAQSHWIPKQVGHVTWVNHNSSQTWIEAIKGDDDFPTKKPRFPVRENSEVVIIYPDISTKQWMACCTPQPPWLDGQTVGRTIINHPPVITIDKYKPFQVRGGLWHCYTHMAHGTIVR